MCFSSLVAVARPETYSESSGAYDMELFAKIVTGSRPLTTFAETSFLDVSMFSSWVVVCKLSKKVQFLQFCAEVSKKPKSVETIYIYAAESSHYPLSENAMAYRDLSHRSWDISDWNIKKDADSVEN